MSHRNMLAINFFGIMALMHIVKTNQLQANGVQKQGL